VQIQTQNRISVHEQNFKPPVTIDQNSAHKRVDVKQQNFQPQSVPRNEQNRNKAYSGEHKRASAQVVAQISQTQRLRIRKALHEHARHFHLHRVAYVGFPIFIGAYVPRDYTVYDVPPDFVEYVPEYEGYKYIVVGDELLIIDPETWEIVAIIPL
jgi:Protein of unknown function (DUF1236)